jgi:ABC-type multidrug transport system ATPase subunit
MREAVRDVMNVLQNACRISNHSQVATTVAVVPERDVLQEDQSVEEHMRIAGILRGLPADRLEEEVCSMSMIMLTDKY